MASVDETQALWLEKGRVIDFGEPERVLAAYHKSSAQRMRPAPPAGQQAAVAPIR